MSFQTLGLSETLLRALAAKSYTVPTPIQRDAIPLVLEGRDLLGIAQTGTGKTAAFTLPAIQRLAAGAHAKPRQCRMLVLAPTRELASQIADSAKAYGQFNRLSVTTAFGGVPIGRQQRALERGVDILVATPGRLLDLVDQTMLSLAGVEILVLDEADQMLDLGFIHALKRIVRLLPKKRQTLFFSATMPASIRELASQYLVDPAQVAVTPVASAAPKVEQSVTFVNQAEKQALLTLTLKATAIERALVFTRTKHGADKVVKHLVANGIGANAIHGNKSQPQRERALAEFRSGQTPVLVATDIAARGIDVSGVSHVFNFELPNVPEQYVHRIGRTGRAGATGQAIAFCAEDERPFLRDIEKLTRVKVPVIPLPDDFLRDAARLSAPPRSPPQPQQAGRSRAPGGERRGPMANGDRRGSSQPRRTFSAQPTAGNGGGRGGRRGGGRQAGR